MPETPLRAHTEESRDDPETLLMMVRETESENRRLGALVASLRAELASKTLTPEEARRLQELLHLIYDIPEFEFRKLEAKLRALVSSSQSEKTK